MPILSPQDLKKIANDAEMEERKAEAARRRQAEQSAASLRQAFEARQLDPQTPDRINSVVRAAAARGEHEILVLRFPAEYCSDGGRRVNNFDPTWPESLTGFAKTAYDYYEHELQPLGFSMRAEIMSFPGGNMGDVGMHLRW